MNRFIQLCASIATGVLHSRTARRRAMFALTLAAAALLFAGAVPLWPFLLDRPFLFALYWLLCGWLTVCTMLLAIYDLVQVLREGRAARRAARREIFGKKDDV